MQNNWQTKKLGEVCDILDNKRKPITKRNRAIGEYPYYGATGILDYVGDYIFNEKLVLIGEDGAKWESGEHTAFIADGKYWVNNHAHVIRPHRNIVLDNWIVFYFYLTDLTKYTSGLTVPKLNQTNLRNIEIPLPPLPEQHRIVKILDEVFANVAKAKENAEKNLQNAKDLFESYLQSVFANPGKDWEEKRLSDFFDITSSKRVFKSEWKNKGVPFYRAREIVKLAKQGFVKNELFISEEMYEKYSDKYGIPKEGDIMVTGVGTLGICYVVKQNDKFYFKDGNIIWLKTKGKINSYFVEYFFNSPIFKKYINSSNGATVGTFTIIKAKNSAINVPNLIEQKSIVAKLDALSAETRKLETIYKQKLTDLEELKKSVLKSAFAGKL